jgi:hypothetical protein
VYVITFRTRQYFLLAYRASILHLHLSHGNHSPPHLLTPPPKTITFACVFLLAPFYQFPSLALAPTEG